AASAPAEEYPEAVAPAQAGAQEIWIRLLPSVELDIGRARDLAPALDLRPDVAAELFRRAADHLDGGGSEPLANLRILQRLPDGAVEPLDDRARRSLGREHAIPEACFHAVEAALGESRHVGQQLQALVVRRGERAQPAGLHVAEKRRRTVDHEVHLS